jgi:hypothetical protein
VECFTECLSPNTQKAKFIHFNTINLFIHFWMMDKFYPFFVSWISIVVVYNLFGCRDL